MGYNSANSSNQNWNSYPINLSLKIPTDQVKEIPEALISLTTSKHLHQVLKLQLNRKEVLHEGVFLVVSPMFQWLTWFTLSDDDKL